jgi:DNA-binding Lrp family transcriptional regulator
MDNIDIMLLRLLVSGPMHTTQMARFLRITEDQVVQRMGHLQDLGLVGHISPEAN